MRRLLAPLVAAGALGLLTVSCGGSSSSKTSATVPPNAGAVVDMKNIAFNPHTVTIKAGQTVAWKFDDGSIIHDVVGEGFRSPDQSSGVFLHTFAKAGTYNYQCVIHSGMNGVVIVN
jgi:plastocyanin